MNKKGLSTFSLFLYVFVIFFGVIFLGLALFIFNQINDVLDVDIDVGQFNLRNVTAQTFGKINAGFADNADTIGVMLVLMMSFIMILNGFIVGSKFPKIFLVVDILILIFVFIVAVYLSQVYEIFINSTTLLDVYINDIPNTSTFMLNLPLVIGTLGALIMIFSYAGIRKKEYESSILG